MSCLVAASPLARAVGAVQQGTNGHTTSWGAMLAGCQPPRDAP